MEPEITEKDVALLLMSQDSWVALGAMLALRPWMDPGDEVATPGLPTTGRLPH
jgi:hypothetical protein